MRTRRWRLNAGALQSAASYMFDRLSGLPVLDPERPEGSDSSQEEVVAL
jgi:hypothetical protein